MTSDYRLVTDGTHPCECASLRCAHEKGRCPHKASIGKAVFEPGARTHHVPMCVDCATTPDVLYFEGLDDAPR